MKFFKVNDKFYPINKPFYHSTAIARPNDTYHLELYFDGDKLPFFVLTYKSTSKRNIDFLHLIKRFLNDPTQGVLELNS